MNVNCGNIGREEESLNIISLLNRIIKTREIFSSVTRVLRILLTTAATSASVERINSKERVPNVPCSIPTMRRCELSAAIAQLMSKCL